MIETETGDENEPVPTAETSTRFTRRRVLGGVAVGVAGGGLIAWLQRNSIVRWFFSRSTNDVAVGAVSPGGDVCVLTPEQIEGPYYIRSPFRSDIREDRVGLDLTIDFHVVSMPDCEPLPGATVEIWHCDAQGNYAGYEEGVGHNAFDTFVTLLRAGDDHIDAVNDATYLRGAQTSDDAGRVQFQTIFPGWYDPRVTHIHLKVSMGEQAFLTTQLYFPDELVDRVYAEDERYAPFGACPYDLTTDFVIGDLENGTGLLLDATEVGDGLTTALRVGVVLA